VVGVRRMAALAAAGSLAATVATGFAVAAMATPASAADDRVQVRAAGEFDAGEGAEGVAIAVTKRTKGCAAVRAQLGIRLDGLAAGQVRAQAQSGGEWRGIGVSDGGGGVVVTAQAAPDRQVLCERQSATVRYRIAFTGDVESGTATFVGEALTGRGDLMGRDTTSSRVNGVRPSPTPRKTRSPSPTPTTASPTPTEALDTGGPVDGVLATTTSLAALAAPTAADDGGLGPGTLVMAGGVGLVVVGAGLLVFLFVRARGERREAAVAEAPTTVMPVRPAGPDAPTVIMPRLDEP
jgi:hypothetical protein